jgi:parallel beta-helix repeat protein
VLSFLKLRTRVGNGLSFPAVDKRPLTVMLLWSLLWWSASSLTNTQVEAGPSVIRVPQDYPTVQAAVNAASAGEEIQVDTGTYPEQIVVNKTLTLVGAGKGLSVIYARGLATAVRIQADNVTISGFSISSANLEGVFLDSVVGTRVFDNRINSNGIYGITVEYSNSSLITRNIITNSSYGFGFIASNNNAIRFNTIIANPQEGISASDSNNNIFEGNTLSKNGYGIAFTHSSGNILFRNNYIYNNVSAVPDSSNVWDNGAEGNYWSNYLGQDGNGDGIGDTPHPIHPTYEGINDSRPLVQPWSLSRTFPVGTWDSTDYFITIAANATVASFNYNQTLGQISFNLTSPQGSHSFCNATIPKPVLDGNPWTVFMGAVNVTSTISISANASHTLLHFSYVQQSTQMVRIVGTEVPIVQPKIHDVAMNQVAFEPDDVIAGESISIIVNLMNKGNFSETFNVTVSYDTRAIGIQLVDAILPSQAMNLTFFWNTTDVAEGSYSIHARTDDMPNDKNPLDNSQAAHGKVRITHPVRVHDIAIVAVELNVTRATIGQTIQVSVTVANQGNFAENFTVTVSFTNLTIGARQEIIELDANTTRVLLFPLNTTGLTEGTYSVTARSSTVNGETDLLDNKLSSFERVVISGPGSQFPVPLEALALLGTAAVFAVGSIAFLLIRQRRKRSRRLTKR